MDYTLFDNLKKYAARHVAVIMKDGKVYEGQYLAQEFFKDDKERIKRISVYGTGSLIINIKTANIESILVVR